MANATHVLEVAEAPSQRVHGRGRLAVSLLAVVALLGAALVIAHDAGTPTAEESTKAVTVVDTAAVADSGAPAALRPQIGAGAFACPVLEAVINLFLGSPFFGLVVNILIRLRVAFGCISPG